MPTNPAFDDELLRQINAKASELYLRDKHPYELAYLLFVTLHGLKKRFSGKYQQQIDWFSDLFNLREDFQMHSKNVQFRTARMTIIRTVMEDAETEESSKYEMVRVLSDAYELIDHLGHLYQIARRPSKEHVNQGILDASALVSSGISDAGPAGGPAVL